MTNSILQNSPSYTYTTNTTPSYTINSNGISGGWSPTSWSADSISINPSMIVKPAGKIELTGEDADIEINGASLVKMLKRIEERINILTVNADLEAEWDELRELGDQYRALEQRIKHKMETWSRLKAEDKENR